MDKKPSPAFLIIGIGFILTALFIFIRNTRYQRVVFEGGNELPNAGLRNQANQQPSENSGQAGSETQGWMKFGGIDLLEQAVGFEFSPACGGQSTVKIPPVEIEPWHPEVFENGEFGIGKNLAVAWEHLGYEGLWIHSGWDFWQEQSPATALQYFLETDELNQVQNLKTIEERLRDCLRGSTVRVEQELEGLNGTVAAAVRVPPRGVEELSEHTMDLVPFLAQAYPGAGFEDIDEKALLLFFCGRAALDEPGNPEADYWTQARYVIALMPAQ